MKIKRYLLLTMVLALTMLAIITSANAQLAPTLKASVVSYSPVPANPGDSIDLWVSITNTGTVEAKNVNVAFVDSFPFKLSSETDRQTIIPLLSSGSQYLIKYTVKVDGSASAGANFAVVKYGTGANGNSQITSRLKIDLASTETPISLTNVAVEPLIIVPGSKAKVTLSVKNMAKAATLRDVSVNMQLTPIVSATSILIDLPFVPINSGNQKNIDKILPGQTTDFVFDIAAYPTAAAQLYKVPVKLSYTDDSGTYHNKTVLIGLEVNAKSELLVNIDSADINSQKMSGDISIGVTNKGINNIKLTTLTIDKSDAYDILSPANTIYVGNIDSDDYQTARFTISAKKTGVVTIPVTVEYKDSLNNNYKESYNLEYDIRAPEQTSSGSPVLTIIIILIVAIVGFVIYRRRKKKRKN